jgi:probable F420-dependent oxidoreductase
LNSGPPTSRPIGREDDLKVVAMLMDALGVVPERARKCEALGFDALSAVETVHDPFFPLLLAAEHTSRIRISTNIAVAFARNPMILANIGHDLQSYSKGRFTLGLGSQIKPHITRRFSMPWSAPAARMKEMVQAINAIWDCWYDGKPLAFQGEFYTHTLMPPKSIPRDTQYGRPRITVAAVGPLMTKAAAEAADGVICHAFTTERYLREVTTPMIERTLAGAGRARSDFEVIYSPFVMIAPDGKPAEEKVKAVREHIAFYASTPAYRAVLELHGWGDVQPVLQAMTRAGEWAKMGDLITDEMFDAFAIVGDAASVADTVTRRYGGLVDTIHLPLGDLPDDEAKAAIMAVQAG